MKNESNDPRFLALLAAAVLPGLGHVVAGERARGVLVGVGVLGLFFGGMLVGGIDVIDSKDNRVWFIGQALVGPVAFGVDWVHQERFKGYDPRAVQGIVNAGELGGVRKRSAYPNETRQFMDVTTNQGVLRVPVFVETPGVSQPPNRTSVGKVNELGTLFATIAGMLNLIAVIDASFPGRPKREEKGREEKKPGGGADGAPAGGR
jgi:hypothetical protein